MIGIVQSIIKLVITWFKEKHNNYQWFPHHCRNSILMTYHYPDLRSASDQSCQKGNCLQPIKSTIQIQEVTRHQYFCSHSSHLIQRGNQQQCHEKEAVFSGYALCHEGVRQRKRKRRHIVVKGKRGRGEVVHMENDTKFCCSNTIIHSIVQMYSFCFTLQAQNSNFY